MERCDFIHLSGIAAGSLVLPAWGRPVRIDGNLVPPMKIRDFTFSSLSDAV